MFHACITGIHFPHIKALPDALATSSRSEDSTRIHRSESGHSDPLPLPPNHSTPISQPPPPAAATATAAALISACHSSSTTQLVSEEDAALISSPHRVTFTDSDESSRSFGGSSWRSENYSRSNSVQVDNNGFLRGDITTKHNFFRSEDDSERSSTDKPSDPTSDHVEESVEGSEGVDDEMILGQVYGPEYSKRRTEVKQRHFDMPEEFKSPTPSSTPQQSEEGKSDEENPPPSTRYSKSAQRRATTLIASKTSVNATDASGQWRPLQSIMKLVAPSRATHQNSDGSSPSSGAGSPSSPTHHHTSPHGHHAGNHHHASHDAHHAGKSKMHFFSRFGQKPAKSEDLVAAHHTGKHTPPTRSHPSKILTSTVGNAPQHYGSESAKSAVSTEGSESFGASSASHHSIDLSSILSPEQIESLYHVYTQPVIENFQLAVASSKATLEQYHEQNALDNNANTRTAAASLQLQLASHCGLEEEADAIINELQLARSLKDVEKRLRKRIDNVNVQLSLRWSVLLVAMRRMMYSIRRELRESFMVTIKGFWRQQMIISTRSPEKVDDLLWNEDYNTLQTLQYHMEVERNQDRLIISGQLLYPLARQLSVFDADVHMIPSRLPYMFLEQHVPPSSASSSSSNERLFDNLFNASLSTSSLTTSHSHSITHLVILVHGFLGCEADMWLLAQALHLIFPSREHLRTFIPQYCEASAFSEKLEVMGNRLADQLFHYFKEKMSEIFLDDDPTSEYRIRVSFFAHSMGGVVVRHALRDPRLQCLKDKLQVFVSMACPHIGTLYMSSTLVSAGMWALTTFRHYSSLKELNLEDEGINGDLTQSFVYKLSEKKTDGEEVDLLACFRRVVFISAPEDQYVPTYSANVELPPSIAKDGKSGEIIATMARNLLARLDVSRIIRLVLFNLHSNSSSNHIQAYTSGATTYNLNASNSNITESLATHLFGNAGNGGNNNGSQSTVSTPKKPGLIDLNTAIGRTAHICYLENAQLTKQLVFILSATLEAE
eukprot:scaffold420_cov169-Ochromonas_danica.AAC.31